MFGLDAWQQWYDAAGIAVPVITPGSEMKVRIEWSADHGGQYLFMIACGNEISESINWTYLEQMLFVAHLLTKCKDEDRRR